MSEHDFLERARRRRVVPRRPGEDVRADRLDRAAARHRRERRAALEHRRADRRERIGQVDLREARAALERVGADRREVRSLKRERSDCRLVLERAHSDAGCVFGDDDLGGDRALEAGHDRAGPREAEGRVERAIEGIRRNGHAVFKPEHVV